MTAPSQDPPRNARMLTEFAYADDLGRALGRWIGWQMLTDLPVAPAQGLVKSRQCPNARFTTIRAVC